MNALSRDYLYRSYIAMVSEPDSDSVPSRRDRAIAEANELRQHIAELRYWLQAAAVHGLSGNDLESARKLLERTRKP